MQDSFLYGIIGFLIVILIIITIRKPYVKSIQKKEEKDTKPITPNVNCEYTYEDCNKPCGPGKQKLKIIKPSSGTGTPCPTLLEKDCKIKDCPGNETDTPQQTPKNCVPGAWSEWSTCTKPCGEGTQTRTRVIAEPASNGGTCNIQTTETQPCNTQACPKNCVPSSWNEWSNCTKPCGGGSQTRSRLIAEHASNGGTCNIETIETQACNIQACPVPKNCVPGEWGNWSSCTKSCGGGIQSRLREIKEPASNGGICTEHTIETRDCNNIACPIEQPPQNCISTWSEWSQCTAPCGGGSQTRSRIIQVPALNGGTCEGQMTETRSCNLNACPEDCKLSTEINESRCLENNKKIYIDILQNQKNGGKDCLEIGNLKDGKEWRYDGGNNRIVRDEACITPVDCKLGGVYEGECDWRSKKKLMADILSPPIGMGRSCSEMSNLIGDLQRWTHDLSNNKMFREVDCVRVENCKLGNVYNEWACTNNRRVHSTNIFSEPKNGGKSCVQVAKESYGNYDWVLDPSGGRLNRVESCITPINCKLSLEQERGECINDNQILKMPILSQPVGDGWSCEKVANQATAEEWQVSQDRSFVFRNKECISPVDCELGNLTIRDCSGGFSRKTFEIVRQRRGTGKICSTIASQNDMLRWIEDISNRVIYADKKCADCVLSPTSVGASVNNMSLVYTRILDIPKNDGLSCIDMAKEQFGNFDWKIDPSNNTVYRFEPSQVSPGAIRFGSTSAYKSEFLFGETETKSSVSYRMTIYKDGNNNFVGFEIPSNFQITPSSNISDFIYCTYSGMSGNSMTFKSTIPFSSSFKFSIDENYRINFISLKPFNIDNKVYYIYIDRDCQLADDYTIGDCIFRDTQTLTFKITEKPLGTGKSCLQTALEKTNRKIEHVDISSIQTNVDTFSMKTACNIDCSLGGGITGNCIANTFRVSYPIIKNPVGQGQLCNIIAKQKYGDFTYFEDLSVNRVFRINNCTVPDGYIRFGTASNKKEEYEISQIANQSPFMKIVIYRNVANNLIGIELPSGLKVSANSTINDWVHGEYIYRENSESQSLIRLSTFNNLNIILTIGVTNPVITIGQNQYPIRSLNCKLDSLATLPCINNKIEHFYKINTPAQGIGRSCISEALEKSPGFNWLQTSDRLFRLEDCVNCDLSGLRIGECVNDKRLNTAFIKTFPSSNGTNCIDTAKQLYGDKYWEQNNPNRWVSYIENCRECDLSGLEYGSCLNNNQTLASRIIMPGMGGTSCVDMAKVKFTELPSNTWSEDVGIIAVKTTVPCTIPTNRIRFGQVSDISTNFTIFENENRTGVSQGITVYYNSSNDVIGIEFPRDFSISSSTTNSFRNNIINFSNALFSFDKINNRVFLTAGLNNFIRITLPKQATATSTAVNMFEFFDPIVGTTGIKRYYNNPPNINCEFTYGQCDKPCGPGKQPLQIIKYPSGTGLACPTAITSPDCKIKDCDADCKLSTNIQTSNCIQDNRIISFPILTGPVGEGLVCTSVAQQGNNFTWSQSSDNTFVFRNEACITPVDCSLQNLIISDCSSNKVIYTYDIKIPTRGEGKSCTLVAREMDGSLNWIEDLSRSLVFRTENCADCRLEPVSGSTPYFGACVNNNRLAYVKILSLPQGRGKSCLDMVKQRFGNFDWQFDIGANVFYRLEQCNTVTGMIRFGNNSDKMEIVKFGTTTIPNVVINIVIYRNNLNNIIGVDVPSNFNFPDNVPITRFLYSTYYGFGSGNKLLFRSQIANSPQFSITLGESDIVFATVMNPTGNMFEKTQRYFRYVDQNCELAPTFKTIPCSSLNSENFEFTITTPAKGSGVTCLQRAIERTNTKPEYVTGSSTIGTFFKMNRVCNIDCSLGSAPITGGCSDNTNRVSYPVLRNKMGDGKTCDIVAKQLYPQFSFFNDTSLNAVFRLANCLVPEGYIRFGTVSSNKTEYNISVLQNTAPFMKIVVHRNNTNNIIGLELPKGLQITDTMTALNYVHGELIVSTTSTIRADVKVSTAINFYVTLYPDNPVPVVIFPGRRYFIKK